MIRFKFHPQREKGKGKRGYGGEAQNEVLLGFFAKFPLLSKVQTLSHKLLVRQTSHHHCCNWHAQKPNCKDFQVILSSSSWSKTTLIMCIFEEQIWLPNRKCYEKNKLCFDSLSTERSYLHLSANTLHR